jgi:hypothetical protein
MVLIIDFYIKYYLSSCKYNSNIEPRKYDNRHQQRRRKSRGCDGVGDCVKDVLLFVNCFKGCNVWRWGMEFVRMASGDNDR